jgi:hypothetical protein
MWPLMLQRLPTAERRASPALNTKKKAQRLC